MEDDASLNPSLILLGRSFLKTSKIKINVNKGILAMEFDGELTKFDIFKNFIENQALSSINMINVVLQVPPMSEVAIRADEKSKMTSLHKTNTKAKLNGGGSLITEKKLKGRKIYKCKSIVEGTSYFSI